MKMDPFLLLFAALVTGTVEEEVRCPLGEFPCGNISQCLPQNLQCDGRTDCPNGADELLCGKCKNNYFKCQ